MQITKTGDPTHKPKVIMIVYGPGGIGKSTFSTTAPKPLLLDFENGSKYFGLRGINVDVVKIEKWEDVMDPELIKTIRANTLSIVCFFVFSNPFFMVFTIGNNPFYKKLKNYYDDRATNYNQNIIQLGHYYYDLNRKAWSKSQRSKDPIIRIASLRHTGKPVCGLGLPGG